MRVANICDATSATHLAHESEHPAVSAWPPYPGGMDRPIPDPAKLLAYWDEWERGETTPGRVLANLKTAGLPDLLRDLVSSPSSQV
jgi:hypothetical protein